MIVFKFTVILFILFVTLTQINGFPTESEAREKKYLTLDDALNRGGKFQQKSFNGSWISGTEFLYSGQSMSGLYLYNVTTQTSSQYLSMETLLALNTSTIILSPDRKFVLASSDTQKGFRHSSLSRYALYDLEKEITYKIADHKLLQSCIFGGKDHSLAFVLDNDVYFLSDATTRVSEIRLTFDGVPGIIYNGVPDWVYEEEVLSQGSSLWFSPDGSHLAMASFNDTLVDTAVYMTYGVPGSIESQYPQVQDLKYPKVGRTNPLVALRVVRLSDVTGSLSWKDMPAPVGDVGEDHILGAVTWAGNQLAALWLNRRQNKSVLVLCGADNGNCRNELVRTQPDGWIDISTPLFSDDGSYFLDIEPVGGWFHLVRRQVGVPAATALTSGKRTVTKILGWNKDDNIILYTSTLEEQPWQLHVHAAGAVSACLSCGTRLLDGSPCRVARATVSLTGRYYAQHCEGAGPGYVQIFDSKKTDTPLVLWEDNAKLYTTLSEYYLPNQRNLMIAVPGPFNGTAKLFLPPELDISNPARSYPMVVFIYTGPNSVRVADTFQVGFQSYMSTNRSTIYCFLEGRGSGNKGTDMLFSVNNKLGTVEIEDVISMTKRLTEIYSWIDAANVGVWGWSYGGYATGMVLAKDAGHVFKCGVSVAPVTSWIYYDSIYTERFMGLATREDNMAGYVEADLTKRAKSLKDRNFLLMHGNADDNVHYQNAMALVRELQKADIEFELMSYPDEAHGLNGVTKHVYHTIDDFWMRCFSKTS